MPGERPPRPPLPERDAVAFSVTVALTERIDRFLADQLGMSRTQTARLVAGGAVTVEGSVARASRAAERERTRIAHENLRRISIVPQKAYTRSYKRRNKN